MVHIRIILRQHAFAHWTEGVVSPSDATPRQYRHGHWRCAGKVCRACHGWCCSSRELMKVGCATKKERRHKIGLSRHEGQGSDTQNRLLCFMMSLCILCWCIRNIHRVSRRLARHINSEIRSFSRTSHLLTSQWSRSVFCAASAVWRHR